jgi:hypothetical protein
MSWTHTVELDGPDHQAVLLALAVLSLERPGWLDYLGRIADRFNGRGMFDGFRRANAGPGRLGSSSAGPRPE